MDSFKEILQLILFVLLVCRLGALSYGIKCDGEVTVEQDLISLGSNVTVHCKTAKERCGLFLIKLNEQIVVQKEGCSKVTAHLVILQPKSWIYCGIKHEEKRFTVCGRDIEVNLIPSVPQITAVVFTKGSLSPTVHWRSADDTGLLNPMIRFRRINDEPWVKGRVTQIHRGKLEMLEELEPLTSYQFEVRVCTASMKLNCSLWSSPVYQSSPGKAPSRLDVWRVITRNEEEGNTQNVTVLWKAFPYEAHTTGLQGYELIYQMNGTTQYVNCSASVRHYTLQLPLEVTELTVSAITIAGNSPPAAVSLVHLGRPAPEPDIRQAAGGGIELVWNSSHTVCNYTSKEILGFVVQWHCSPLEVRWKRLKKDHNSAVIEDTPPCTSYNVSLYVETTEGVSWPAFGQVHSKERNTLAVPRSDVFPPGHIISIMPSTSYSAAEWPSGGVLIGICVMAAVSIFILVNLMCLKCARQRMAKVCRSVGPSWLFENLPKLTNSNAIKSLKDERYGSDLCYQPVDSDPPLSPVEDFTPLMDRKDLYPTVHKKDTIEETKVVQNWTVCPYKPQVSIVSQIEDSVSEVVEKDEDEHPWVFFPSPAFSKFDEEFFPSQGMHGPLNSRLTLNGTPISVDDIGGLFFFTQNTLDENIWRMEGDGVFGEPGNGDQSFYQGQTVLPNDFLRFLREPVKMPDVSDLNCSQKSVV